MASVNKLITFRKELFIAVFVIHHNIFLESTGNACCISIEGRDVIYNIMSLSQKIRAENHQAAKRKTKD
jgi:hypothetical protein